MDQQMRDFIRVADEFGKSDDIKLETVEQRLAQYGIIDGGEKMSSKKAPQFGIQKITKKTIRNRKDSGSDDADDW